MVVRDSVLFFGLIAKKSLPATFSQVKNNLPALMYHHIVFNSISGNNKNVYKNCSDTPSKNIKIGCLFKLRLESTTKYLVVKEFIDNNNHFNPTIKKKRDSQGLSQSH